MSSNPLVSIIMPAFKSESFIARSVKTVLEQTYKNWELVIIADDQQNYEKILSDQGIKHPSIRHFSTDKTGSGPQFARNIGIDNATGDLIFTLDDDDEFTPNKLELMAPKALEYGLCSSDFDRIEYINGTKLDIENYNVLVESGPVDTRGFLSINFSANSIIGFDRRKAPVKYPEYIGYIEDLMLSVSCFDYIEKSYHLKDKLHRWVKRRESLSNCDAAPKNFISAKEQILQKIDNNSINIRNKESVQELRKFIEMSLKCEKIFDQELMKGIKDIDFIDVFITEISRLYPEKIYEYKGKKFIRGENGNG